MASFNLFEIYVTMCFAIVIHPTSCSTVEHFFFLIFAVVLIYIYLPYQLFSCSISFLFSISIVLL